MTLTLLITGLLFLLGGGALLVRGASQIAAQHGVSPVLVGLTVVAFGTSAPELVVNIIGALRDQSALAFGNVVGSNLANLGLVLTCAALVRPMKIEGQIVRRELPLLLLGTTVLLVMTLDQPLMGNVPEISRSDSLVLFLLLGVFIYVSFGDALSQSQDPFVSELNASGVALRESEGSSVNANWIYVGAGTLLLGIGGHLTVSKGVVFAEMIGLPTVVVGMLVLAIGTSLPELVTSVIAAIKNESDLCLGNVIGSNLFNSLFVLPVSAMIRPVAIPSGGIMDIFLTLAFSAGLLLVFFFNRATLDRKTAFVLLSIYLMYMWLRTQQ